MVSLNVTLDRLVKSEEAELASETGRKTYRWAFRNELPADTPGFDLAALLKDLKKSGTKK